MNPIRLIRSATKLSSIVIANLWAAVRSATRGDLRTAKEYLRTAGLFLHDDLVQIIVSVQSRFPWRRHLPSKIDRILIVKLDRIGDMVNITPVLDVLRERFPGARLEIVGHPVPLSLFDGDDRIDGAKAYRSALYHALPLRPPGPRSWWLLLKLLQRRYPLVLYLRGSFLFLPLALTSRLAATKFVENEHVLDRYFKPLERLLGPIPRSQPRLHIDVEAAHAARNLLVEDGWRRRPAIAIHPAASAPSKMWPAERFGELADRLQTECGAQVHFVGSPADQATLEAIAEHSQCSHAYHSSLKLPDVVALIAECDLFVGNDSGLSHIAAAVGTKLIVIWGPAVLSTARPAAPAGRMEILHHDLPCRATCPEICCNSASHLECLMRTEVADVMAAARYLLQLEPTAAGAAGCSEMAISMENPVSETYR
jgi:ADP-heptose:LPS heptosyltransferase